ncbi:MAG TPA: fused MFS/spermidine synthase [Planctomycetota bacterium]|nr:fused MFS/spermidine synthase [Planctomycetota bacterium]
MDAIAEHRGGKSIGRFLPAVFFASGFAALVYQIAWQRALFLIFGIHTESVTVIVTAFMLGLGLGSLLGGRLSRRGQQASLYAFGVLEAGIGAFGILSLTLFRWVGDLALLSSPWVTGLATMLLLLLPTLLMGATLPILVSWMVTHTGNVGRSVGGLYAVNTFGSALASLLTAVLLFPLFGLRGSILFAAAINLLVSLTVVILGRREEKCSA